MVLPGVWLVVVPGEGVDGEWVESLVEGLGSGVVRLVVSGRVDRAGLVEQLRGVVEGGVRFAGVVSLLGVCEGWRWSSVPVGVVDTAVLVQALDEVGVGGRLWVVTCGAVSVGVGELVGSVGQGGLWGLGRVAALEYPELWGGVVDVPVELSGGVVRRLVGVLGGGVGDEDQVAVRGGGVYGRRLVPAPAPVPAAAGGGWEPSGTVLITGGTGVLGGHVARWLAGRGVEHLLLLSRRG
ncbi:KR domain-containing protein, partial [Streptomyces coffeae]